jgi:hypothetical protein
MKVEKVCHFIQAKSKHTHEGVFLNVIPCRLSSSSPLSPQLTGTRENKELALISLHMKTTKSISLIMN